MKTNESTNACPKCGAPVPAEAPQGLCPKCVFVQAVAPEAAPTATANIPSLERLAVAFPQLQIIELIGRGGMGFVFQARQPHLDRFVALKLLPDSLAHDPHFAERFNREGRTLARLNHPNIVSIFDFGQAGGFYYLMMEYVDGVNLRQAMQAGRFSPSEALSIVPKICEALQFAHEEGILHRDIKPENILLDAKGRVKIADFGIAKIVGEENPDVSLTATGAALGTPHYMAPEQFEKPATVDHRADIYSLGVVFYEMLTGELPIGRFSPPSQRTPVDPRVDDVVMRTLEKEREKRFQSAGEMRTNVEHLTEVGAGTFKAAPPKTPTPGAERSPSGTIVIKPESALPAVPAWSLKAVWGAVLVGISLLPVIVLLVCTAYYAASHRGDIGGWDIILIIASLILSLPAIAGTILGWMGLNDIRAHAGQRRGLPLAVFAALAWPLLLLVGGTLVIPSMIAFRSSAPGTAMPLGAMLMLLVPVGTITFAIWAVYTAARWGGNKPASQRRGMLKWVFLALLMFGVGIVLVSRKGASRFQATSPAFDSLPGQMLPEGTIELVAVSQHPFDQSWWQPNGASWTGAAFRTWGVANEAGSSQRFVGFIFRSADSDFNNSSMTYRFAGSFGWEWQGSDTGLVEIDRKPSRNHGFATAAFPAEQQTTTIQVGVATDPWETLATDVRAAGSTVSVLRQNRPVKITFYQATEENFTNTVLTVTDDLENEGIRVLAIDVDGREHLGVFQRFMDEIDVTFALPLRQVREFQYQARPYRWTEFKNVKLRPNTTEKTLREETNLTSWIRFTFTAVELLEAKGVRWLAIDYLDDVHGDAQKAFPWETTIPGFKAQTRTTEFFKESEDSKAKLARLRGDLFNTEAQLAEYRSIAGNTGSTANNDKDAATVGTAPEKVAEYKMVCARLDAARANEFDLLVQYTEENPLVRRVRERIAEHETRKKSLETENPKLTALYIPQTSGRSDTGSGLDPARVRAFESQISTLSNQIAFVRNNLGFSPAVRHQRIEYRMPDSSPRDQLERLRDNLEKALKHKSFRLELGENQVPLLLFELPGAEGGSLKAWIKVIPLNEGMQSREYRQVTARLESLLVKEQELLQKYTPEHPVVRRLREQIDNTQKEKARLEQAPLSGPDANLLMLQFRLVADGADTAAPVDVMMESRRDGTSVPRRVLRTVLLDGSAVARAGIVLETNDHRTIGVELTAEGARQFGAITAANINRQLAIVAGGRVLTAPIIRSPIHGGELQISGNMSSAEVHKLVAELNQKPAGLEFSPTVERSLPRAPEFPPGAICLDLESGTFMTNRTFRADQRGTRDWLQTSGVDLVAIDTTDQIPVISAYDLAFIEAPTNAWESMPPQEVGWNWTLMRDAAKQESHLATMPGRPDTFLFRTRENGFGLLQIFDATNPAPVVNVRYKLVKDAPAK